MSPGRKLIYGLMTAALVLGFQELAFRAVFPVPEVVNFNRMIYTPLFPQQDNPRFLAHDAFRWISDPDDAESVHRLNLYGFRDHGWSISPTSALRLLVIGDSLVEGFLGRAEAALPRALSDRARERGEPLEVLNLGIGASQLREYFLLVRDAVPLLKPRSVLVVIYANDLLHLPPYDPAWLEDPLAPQWRSPWAPRAATVIRSLLEGRTVALAWHRPPFQFIAPVPDPRNPWSDADWATDHDFVAPAIRIAMERGHFNAYAVNYYSVQRDYLRQEIDWTPYLAALHEYVSDHGAELHLAYLPANNQVSDAYLPFQARFDREENPASLMGPAYQVHARSLTEASRRLGISFLDLTPLIREREAAGERLYWRYDEHLQDHGYRLLGRHLADWILFSESASADDSNPESPSSLSPP